MVTAEVVLDASSFKDTCRLEILAMALPTSNLLCSVPLLGIEVSGDKLAMDGPQPFMARFSRSRSRSLVEASTLWEISSGGW